MRWDRQILTLSFFLLLGCREPPGEPLQPQTNPEDRPAIATTENEFFQIREEGLKRRRVLDRDETSVRVKLKRDPKDGYTWELSGNSAKEILKVDKQLRRELLTKPETGESRH
jgi:hypothetical protein